MKKGFTLHGLLNAFCAAEYVIMFHSFNNSSGFLSVCVHLYNGVFYSYYFDVNEQERHKECEKVRKIMIIFP